MQSYILGSMMKILFGILLFLLSSLIAYAQPKLPGQWSLEFDGGISGAASASMNGTQLTFESDLSRDYNNKTYPFGDSRALTLVGGGQLSYRFPESDWSLYTSVNGYFSYVDNGFARNTAFSENATMFVNAYTIGTEYTIGRPSELFNVFGRAGLTLSMISGEVNYFDFHTEIPIVYRGGIDLGLGGRLNFSFAPLALEAVLSYLNANIVGESYTPPTVTPPAILRERELNDGKNPNDPSDNSRTIAYLSLRIGARIWF